MLESLSSKDTKHARSLRIYPSQVSSQTFYVGNGLHRLHCRHRPGLAGNVLDWKPVDQLPMIACQRKCRRVHFTGDKKKHPGSSSTVWQYRLGVTD